MQNLPLTDDFIQILICAILKEVEKIPDVQKNALLMMLINIAKSVLCK